MLALAQPIGGPLPLAAARKHKSLRKQNAKQSKEKKSHAPPCCCVT